jgi:hypothetical protein
MPPRVLRIAFLPALTIVALLALQWFVVPVTPPPPVVITETLVQVEPAVVDLGECMPEVAVTRSVTIRNLTDKPVRILRAVADCGCTTSTVPVQPIAPRASAAVEIAMRPGADQGVDLKKRVTFDVEGGLPASCTVTGTVGRYISCTPTTIDAPAEVAGAPPGEIILQSERDTPFIVTEVDPSIEVEVAASPAVRQVIHVDWTAWQEADRPFRVNITTNHPGSPKFGVTIRRP